MTSILDEHLEAGELTDLPGHCKFCGSICPVWLPLSHDAWGEGFTR